MNLLRPEFFLSAIVFLSIAGGGQLPPGTTDSSQQQQITAGSAQDDRERLQASEALDHHDFPTALRLLVDLALRNPKDAHVLFDLASAQDALDQNSNAEDSYRRAIAVNGEYFEAHLALGLLLARTDHPAEARSELLAAVALQAPDPALKARAYRALARVDEKQNPAEARDALLSALKISPESSDDVLLSASLAAGADDPASAEQALRRALVRNPGDLAASEELARLLMAQGTPASFEEAEQLLRAALTKTPDDTGLNAELASLEMKRGKPDDALATVTRLHEKDPGNASLSRLYARLLLETSHAQQAEVVLQTLIRQSQNDGELLDEYADALIRLHRSAEAAAALRPLLTRTDLFPREQERAEAAGRLAFAASQSNDPSTVLQALAVRATVLPQSPATLFLAATAHDKLHDVKQAADLYHQFLAAANGKFPDEEFEARHRLITLAHMR